MSERTTYLGTGIGDLDAAKRYLKRKWNQGQPEPIVTRPGTRFYVTARSGRHTRLLLGPYISHMTALQAVPRGRRLAQEASPIQLGFASFGTASMPDTRPTAFGR